LVYENVHINLLSLTWQQSCDITAANISQEFYLQDGGENQLA